MALVRKYGKPDIFLTMTCNPNWEEITRELEFAQTPQDRPDLMVRNQLLKKHILGKVKAYTYVVEFQKRGLPHAHFLLIMTGKYKYTCPEQYDKIISTELPDKHKYPDLYKMVIKHMMHGPFRNYKLDNRWVVPYNPYLLRFFNCHINVEYRNARWVTPPEALWRIYGFELSKINPPVIQLQLHLPNMRMVSYHGKEKTENVINCDGTERSMLTAYFETNRLHEKARGILYRDFPEHYTWNKQGKFWKQRKRKATYQVGRIVVAHPGLQVGLNLICLVVTWKVIRVGLQYVSRNIQADLNRPASLTCTPSIFISLAHTPWSGGPTCQVRPVSGSVGTHRIPISLNYLQVLLNHVTGATICTKRGLIEADNTIDDCMIEAELFRMPSSLRRLFATILVFCEPSNIRTLWNNHLEAMSEDYSRNCKCKHMVQQMVLKNIRDMLQSMGKDIRSFPLPEIDEQQTRQTIGTTKLLQTTSLIIWDEASMTKRQAVEALSKSTRDIMDCPNLPFGGKIVVFGGDFRQILPVVRKGTRAQIVDTSLRRSDLWNCMHRLKLVHNMRAHKDPWFAEYLLRIGNGTEETNENGEICLSTNICVQHTPNDNGLDTLIHNIYQTDNTLLKDPKYITSRAILSTRNDCVDNRNLKMIEHFQGDEMVYHIFDSVEDDPHNYYPPEFLNKLTPNGLTPHMLKLKINCPIILLRNINPTNGLCNGTRLVVRGFQKNSINAEIILTGLHDEEKTKINTTKTYTKNVVYIEVLTK
ncbi:hypothetical protein SETIT_3G223300v2 [Setaria italica]|uniref:ATP-dependent DNA helicase n=1 Tax=Setaria italica TaxID=4555 RepID=K3ZCL2_SETIT|nr:hypothetical protein SETIT_3G223300v2 [Setaria italica]